MIATNDECNLDWKEIHNFPLTPLSKWHSCDIEKFHPDFHLAASEMYVQITIKR